ncbi:hypothetical protein U9R90_12400 [Streptomyces sp. E11-3]|uniref:hypothetical protein n=1 Tax=Streptomyces sp. E11-3 TaxID=3110112 RepID=UPI00397ECC31
MIVTNCLVPAKGAWLDEADLPFAASLLSDRVPACGEGGCVFAAVVGSADFWPPSDRFSELPAGAEGDAFFVASAESADFFPPSGRASVLSAEVEDDFGFAAAAGSIRSAGFSLHPVRAMAPRATTVSQRLVVRRREVFIVNCS